MKARFAQLFNIQINIRPSLRSSFADRNSVWLHSKWVNIDSRRFRYNHSNIAIEKNSKWGLFWKSDYHVAILDWGD